MAASTARGSSRPLGRGESPRQQPRDRGHAADLVVDDVAAGLADHLAARPAVEVQGDLVAHRAGRDEEGRLLADAAAPPLPGALTVGSSPKTSSPTSASAMARRIAASGFVTVSLRRSIGLESSQKPIPTRTAACKASPFSTSTWIFGTSRLSVTPA